MEAADVAQADMLRRVDRQPSRIGTAGRAPEVLGDWHGFVQEESHGAPPPQHHVLVVTGADGWRRSPRVLLTPTVGLRSVHDREEKQGRDPVRSSP